MGPPRRGARGSARPTGERVPRPDGSHLRPERTRSSLAGTRRAVLPLLGTAATEEWVMAAPSDRNTGIAPEIPSRFLPGVPYADLPEPKPLRQVLGPSVLLLAGAIGSGEYVLWPYITSQVGLALVWLVIIGVGTQYFLNMEIERYTLATGETAVTGFTRLWKPWGALFIVMTIVPWAWPGWATGGGGE